MSAPSFNEAVSMLRQAADKHVHGDRAHQRMVEIDSLIRDELKHVERVLSEAVQVGMSPATDAAGHLLRAGGKRIRPLMLLLSARCFGKVTEPICSLAGAAEMVHLATLLHDDVIDDAEKRRGEVAARRVWGNAVSVLAGDLLLTHALERTQNCASPDTFRELLVALRKLVDGEVIQLRGRARFDATEATYFQIIEQKTAALFVWAARAGAREAGASVAEIDASGQFGADLGTAFQLVDDVLDYAGDSAMTGKVLFADLAEGKATLPLIYALEANEELRGWLTHAIAGDADYAHRLAREVVSTGAAERVRRLARTFSARASDTLERLPQCAARQVLMGVAAELAARAA